MINYHPSFSSRVNLVYSDSKNFEPLYNSKSTQKVINKLVTNGNDDIVTISPNYEKDMGCSIPVLDVRVTEKRDGKLYFGTAGVLGTNPDDIIEAYDRAKIYKTKIPDSPLNDFLI